MYAILTVNILLYRLDAVSSTPSTHLKHTHFKWVESNCLARVAEVLDCPEDEDIEE